MRHWKAELNAYAGEISVIANALGIEVPTPATSEITRASRVVSIGSQKDEIAEHVAKFKAHQQRLIKQREDFAARELTRMRASAFDQNIGAFQARINRRPVRASASAWCKASSPTAKPP
jgi:hypothetical protein